MQPAGTRAPTGRLLVTLDRLQQINELTLRHLLGLWPAALVLFVLKIMDVLGVTFPDSEFFKLILFALLTLLLFVLGTGVYWLFHVRFVFDWGVGVSHWRWLGLPLGIAIGTAGAFGFVLLMRLSGYENGGGVLGAVTLASIAGTVLTALSEELLFRVGIFQITERIASPLLALVVSSAFFGWWHVNDFALKYTVPPTIAMLLAFTGGLLFAYAYRIHHSLWLPVGLHLAWNYVGGIVSGLEHPHAPGSIRMLVSMAVLILLIVILVEWKVCQTKRGTGIRTADGGGSVRESGDESPVENWEI